MSDFYFKMIYCEGWGMPHRLSVFETLTLVWSSEVKVLRCRSIFHRYRSQQTNLALLGHV